MYMCAPIHVHVFFPREVKLRHLSPKTILSSCIYNQTQKSPKYLILRKFIHELQTGSVLVRCTYLLVKWMWTIKFNKINNNIAYMYIMRIIRVSFLPIQKGPRTSIHFLPQKEIINNHKIRLHCTLELVLKEYHLPQPRNIWLSRTQKW